MVFGIPDEAVMGGVAAVIALVVALKFLGGKKPTHSKGAPEAGGVESHEHTDLEDMVDKPQSKIKGVESTATVEEEEQAGMSVETTSLEALLARPIDEAPSIGQETKTNVDTGLKDVKVQETSEEPIVPQANKLEPTKQIPEKTRESKKDDLKKIREQFGEEFNIDELGDIVAAPKLIPSYTPPKDIKQKAEKEASVERPYKLYDKPQTKRKQNFNRYCMLQFDAGSSPKKVENLLRVKGLNPTSAKQISFKTYKTWIDKREPLIREIKETKEKMKRIEYKFLKRQIDGKAREKILNDSNEKLAELEAKLKGSEDFFN